MDLARKGAELVGKKKMKELDIPSGLSTKGKNAAEAIVRFLTELEMTETGGCRAFYTPEEWADRGEEYGQKAVLIVAHDGGDLARFFNYDYQSYEMIEEMRKRLDTAGVWPEQCTSWYSAVYAR